ncbi:uncharacterized protein [Diadema antillarum]|uniref:uncharacterized protein n=1 Tax=Diadema antillarum TaxID=105358 RepID=UPI003A86686D
MGTTHGLPKGISEVEGDESLTASDLDQILALRDQIRELQASAFCVRLVFQAPKDLPVPLVLPVPPVLPVLLVPPVLPVLLVPPAGMAAMVETLCLDESQDRAQEPDKMMLNSKDDASAWQGAGQLQSDNQTSKRNSVLYVRWGKPDCPQGAELVYSGSVGGEFYSNAGGASNYLCLPDEPLYDEVQTSLSAHRAHVYSSEFQSDFVGHWPQLDDLTPSCAVCLAPKGQTTKLMNPARNVCPSDDWRLEYAGYLMSAKYEHKRTEYICVDRDAEPVPGTRGNQNGALLYHVEGRCVDGSGLPCGPYVHGYELTCAVCTI